MSKEPKTALDFVGRYMSQVVTDSGHQAEVVAVKRPLFRCVQLNLVSKHRVSAGELAGISVNGIRLITNVVNGTMAMKIHDLEVGVLTLMINAESHSSEDPDPGCETERSEVVKIMRSN